MNAHQLRRLFPRASASCLAANTGDFDTGNPSNVDSLPSSASPVTSVPVFRLTVTLPVPSRKLNPNGRSHWAAKAKAVKDYRRTAMLTALAALPTSVQPMLKTATVRVTWFHRTAHRLDATNLIGSLKSAEDGLTDAGIWRNDVGVTWAPPEQRTDKTNPRVELEISSAVSTT